MKKIFTAILLIQVFLTAYAQERIVKIDFESNSFDNNPHIPFNEPFGIIGEAGEDIEFVKVNIAYEGKDFNLHSFVWNRYKGNNSQTFTIVVPSVLQSNTKYDFEIITYKLINANQKKELIKNIENRVRYLLYNNIYFDGKNVIVNNPKKVYKQLSQLIQESFQYYESKNLIQIQAPSFLILEELKKQSDFKFSKFFKKVTGVEKDEMAMELIDKKIKHFLGLLKSELEPFINSQVVQHYRQVNVNSVETDKEIFTLPVNIGMYAWNKTINIDNTKVENINFTLGAGLTIPFNNKSKLATRSKLFDSFGITTGVLFNPIEDANGTKFVTPGVGLPVFIGLGFRMFKVVGFNVGTLILGEKGTQNFNKLTFLPTAGLALELNLWMGVKK